MLVTGGGSSGLAHAEDQSEDAVEDLADGEDDAEATVESDEVPVEGTTEESTVAETDNEKVGVSDISLFSYKVSNLEKASGICCCVPFTDEV